MLRLENVSKYYVNNNVTSKGLDDINLTLKKGEIVAITGESGSGKSTLLNVLTKIDSFDEGEIYYKGNETSYFSINDMEQFRKNKIGFIFQNYNIIDSYTVLENVMVPMLINGVDNDEAKARAKELIEKVGLKDRINHRGTALSGGEKQRCVIARALASNSEILACDEPTGNLDSKTSKEIIELIKEVSKDKLVLIVSHNFDELKGIATRKIKLHDGRIIEDYYLNNDTRELEEENEELDLDYIPMKRKIDFKISMKNLKSTPRKTIFSFIIFLVISALALVLFQYIIYQTSDTNLRYNNFYYRGENKLIIYDKDNKPLDNNKIKSMSDSYVLNPFYEDAYVSFNINGSPMGFGFEAYPKNIELTKGRMPENDHEVILMADGNYLASYIGERLDYKGASGKYEFDFTIVGFQNRTDVTGFILTGNAKAEALYRKAYFESNLYLGSSSRLEGIIDDSRKTQIITNSIVELDDIYYMNYKLIDKSKITITDIPEEYEYLINDNGSNLKYYIDDGLRIYLIIGNDFDELVDSNVFEASIYGNTQELARFAARAGYEYINPKTYTNVEPAARFVANLLGYFYVFLASLSLILIYFITYLILSRIYISKRETYAIFRTLGVTKKDMNKVVKYEVLMQSVISSIVIFIIFFILGKTIDNPFFNMFSYIDIFVVIWYFIILLSLGLLLAKRFNKKLFSFTVNTTIKAGGIRD